MRRPWVNRAHSLSFCYNALLKFINAYLILKGIKVLDNVSLTSRLSDLNERASTLRGYL